MNMKVRFFQKKGKLIAPLIMGLCIAIPSFGWAHHSGAAFDDEKVVELEGTIKEFQWTNPHTWIQVIVENDDGEEVEWSIEWGGPNSLARNGVRPNTFEPGDQVSMRVHPMKNGNPAGGFIGAQFGDGSTVGRWGSAEGEVDEVY